MYNIWQDRLHHQALKAPIHRQRELDANRSLQDIIITSLPNAKAVKIVFQDPSTGLIAGCTANSRKLFLETSTIEASTSLEVLKALHEAVPNAEFLDAPVSGGIPPAHAGTLTFMTGGPESVFEKAKPIMATMGKAENLIRCGGPGAGLATKQINNYIAYCSYVALCEGQSHRLQCRCYRWLTSLKE